MILHQCILSYVCRDSWEMLELFALWQDFGEFPYPGTVLDQPADMVDAFKIFKGEIAAVVGPDKPLTAWELSEILAAAFGGKR